MEPKSDFSMGALQELLRTPAGKRLFQALQKADAGTLQQAAEALRTGNTARATSLLEPYMQPQELDDLVQKLRGGGARG